MANKLILLDRDGVINRERGEHTWRKEDFEILPDVLHTIKRLQRSGHRVIVVSNQSGIALGLYGHDDVAARHEYLNRRLVEVGADAIELFYCPHHPTKGKCICRKPSASMVERALASTGSQASSALMIGDKERDMEAARYGGVEAILMAANTSLMELLIEHEKL